MLNPSLKSPFK